ncbi:MAG: hypothetical protein U9P14_11515, partial [Gemmatimonadota bacterium]|nr:hypothetical protein [Gemmatimonadota bacterium]
MRHWFYLVLLTCLTGLTGCADKITFEPESDLVVIQAYLYAGKPISDIRITSTLGLGSVDSLAPPINDAQVQLIKNGICYLLDPAGKNGYYRYRTECYEGDCPIGELSVEAGYVFMIDFFYLDNVATAQTV